MWHGGPPKQRLWLGPGRCRSGRRDAGTNAKCFAHSRVKRYPLRRYDTNSDANTNCNSNGFCYPNRDGDSNSNRDAYSDAETDAYAEVCADAKSSPHSGAETIETSANVKISSVPGRSEARKGITDDWCFLPCSNGVTHPPTNSNGRLFARRWQSSARRFSHNSVDAILPVWYKGVPVKFIHEKEIPLKIRLL